MRTRSNRSLRSTNVDRWFSQAPRDRAGIRAGDRFALIAWSKNERVCCLSLIKTDELTEMVTGFLGSLAATAAASEV